MVEKKEKKKEKLEELDRAIKVVEEIIANFEKMMFVSKDLLKDNDLTQSYADHYNILKNLKEYRAIVEGGNW